jgi:hypothetical protein
VITAIEVLAGLMSVVCIGVMAVVADRPEAKATLLIFAVAFAFVSAGFQGLKENQKRRHRHTLGLHLLAGQDLIRRCQKPEMPFAATKTETDSWGNLVFAYIAKHFGDGAAVLFDSSDGLTSFGIVRQEGTEGRERNNYESYLRFRCARLAELIGRLS